MGRPQFAPEHIPVLLEGSEIIGTKLSVDDQMLRMTCVSMGNPHAVFFVSELGTELVHTMGPKIENHRLFPRRTNVEFVQVLSRAEIKMRVWERGSGETYACGTGAAAALVAAVRNELTERKVTVHLLGGELELEWAENDHVFKTGPAEFVFEGIVEVEG
jgi:diaminopimelate epimerase